MPLFTIIKIPNRFYKTPPSPERIKKVQELCKQMWGTKTPTVLDAFAGGGSIPFEAARYGLNVLASDLNPVAVVTMKAAIEYPLKFGADLQVEIDKWVKWIGAEAEKRLAPFFPSLPGEKIRDYLWAHTVICPNCESVIPLSPNWWIYKRPEERNWHKWCAARPIPSPATKSIKFELVSGSRGKHTTIRNEKEEYTPDDLATIRRAVGKCLNCEQVIENSVIMRNASEKGLGHLPYAITFKKGRGNLAFRIPQKIDFEGIAKAINELEEIQNQKSFLFPSEPIPEGQDLDEQIRVFCPSWKDMFNPRQLLTLITYVDILDEVKSKLLNEYSQQKATAICTYLAFVFDRCIDYNSRLSGWHTGNPSADRASKTHALSINWNYPEISGVGVLWHWCADTVASEYQKLCDLIGCYEDSAKIPHFEQYLEKTISISSRSADNLSQITNSSVDVIVTDPPYYATIQYAELSDFFYVWQKRTLGDIFPDLFVSELTDKDREAVANPSRFRNMGASPEELADQDYEAKMALAFAEYYRVLRDDGVMTVQFNHKDSGAWDVLAKSLIDAGFEITASWAVSTENPQNLHQAQKNSVSSTVLLVCRKRDPNAGQAWWDDVRIAVRNRVLKEAPIVEENLTKDSRTDFVGNADPRNPKMKKRDKPAGIDLLLSSYGYALNEFSKYRHVLDNSGKVLEPNDAFHEARQAIVDYRFKRLLRGQDYQGVDSLTQWYLIAWDTFEAREFPYDEARQLALAVGGFNVADLGKNLKLLEIKSGTCKFLSPDQRFKKRAFSVNPEEFSARYLVDALHAIITLYQEEQAIEPVRRFLKATGLLSNDLFMRSWEVALKVIPRISDERKRIPEEKALADLWLAMDEIKAKVVYIQPEFTFEGQQSLNFDTVMNGNDE